MKITSAIKPTELCDRTWTQTGAPFTGPDDRKRVENGIESLEWVPVHGSHPAMPGLAIRQAIDELKIPKVDQIAYRGACLDYPDGGETGHYALYGIQGHYKNGRARVYLLDRGCDVIPLASEIYRPIEPQVWTLERNLLNPPGESWHRIFAFNAKDIVEAERLAKRWSRYQGGNGSDVRVDVATAGEAEHCLHDEYVEAWR